MSGKIENINGKVIFSYTDGEYELRSHPYEPCLYIYKNEEMVKILHNAFEVYELPDIFGSNGTVRAIDSRDFDEDAFCKVLVAAINDEHCEMNWTFAANMVK